MPAAAAQMLTSPILLRTCALAGKAAAAAVRLVCPLRPHPPETAHPTRLAWVLCPPLPHSGLPCLSDLPCPSPNLPATPWPQLVVTCEVCRRPATKECWTCGMQICEFCTLKRHWKVGAHWSVASPWAVAGQLLASRAKACQHGLAAAADVMVKVKVKVGKSLHRLNFPVLTSSFRPLFDLPDAPSAVPPTSSEWVPGRPVPKPWRF